jgi:hypothetical protein
MTHEHDLSREDRQAIGLLARLAAGAIGLCVAIISLLLSILIDLASHPYERIRLVVELLAVLLVAGLSAWHLLKRRIR